MGRAPDHAPVAITRVAGSYPEAAPFDPGLPYPEFPGLPGSAPNPVYHAVRETWRQLGYDAARFDTPMWNPLGFLIRPGDRVFIKPNLVTHEYRASCGRAGDVFSVITHPSVVRAVADYAALALRGRGELVIGDNPCIDADFDRLLEVTRLRSLEPVYPRLFGVPCRVLDLRPLRTRQLRYYGFKSKAEPQPGDPEASSILNLGERSCFYGLNPLLFRGVFTNRWETIRHHHGRTHEYSISNTILNSDVYLSIPKLKAHHKVGATLNIKGLVGINANKNFLVHWRVGFPRWGGDEFPGAHRLADYARLAVRHLGSDLLPERFVLWCRDRLQGGRIERWFQLRKRSSHENYRGAWDGNDTCWRMAADLYKLFIEDAAGWRQRQGRHLRTFSVVDGVLGGEGDGPFCPVGKPAQVLVAGENLLHVDTVAARLMDFDLRQIRYLDHLLREEGTVPEEIPVVTEEGLSENFFAAGKRYLRFVPPSGWPRLALSSPSEETENIYADHYSCCGQG